MVRVQDASELIGNTPLVRLNRVVPEQANVYVKLESFNPGFSVKDRIARQIIEDGEQSGQITPETVIIEATSGNTGIGIAVVAAVKGYRTIITMSARNSPERIALLRALGAEVVLTPAEEGTPGAIEEARRIAETEPSAFMARQHWNPSNPLAHQRTTAQEIWNDTEGDVDIFVAIFGTGGTISGVGTALKAHNPDIQIITVEPEESPVLSKGEAGMHGIQGTSPGFVPEILNAEVIDSIELIKTDDAIEMSRRLMREEGLLVGISSGANVAAAARLAAKPENRGKTIVTICCDLAERYLSTPLFEGLTQADRVV
ncbi:MAG: cysteine synthase A [Sphaerobacteraceae bacterium]|nr:MAG: cysteine synthase A [Sphaerobacteraceae bacterium]